MIIATIVKDVAKDVIKVVDYPFSHLVQAIRLLDTVLKDEPTLKVAVIGLLKQIEILTMDGAIAVSADGLNLPADVATVAAGATLLKYVHDVFLPTIQKDFKDVKSDLTQSATT